jgi:ectoine hydroxylase-related dioxygenase (phytanoyl-CoA dioxygenase family)
MKTEINKVSFPKISPQAVDFFNLHGWVVLENSIDREVWEEAHLAWENQRKQCALEMDIPLESYRKEISQWRDLWTQGGIFRKILDSETSVRAMAQEGMDWTGIRLLHDHIIAKPSGTSNRKIPWHQDSMFWPVDVAGC